MRKNKRDAAPTKDLTVKALMGALGRFAFLLRRLFGSDRIALDHPFGHRCRRHHLHGSR